MKFPAGRNLSGLEMRLANGATFTFGQHWRERESPGFAPGKVKIAKLGDALALFADLADESVNREKFALNFPAFRQCDAFEIFLHAAGTAWYYEMHVTPSNSLMQLRLPVTGPYNGSISQCAVSEHLFRSETRIQTAGWQVAAVVPLAPLCEGELIPDQWDISFGRYDHTAGNPEPVISSTSPHTAPNFHRRHEWRIIRLNELPSLE